MMRSAAVWPMIVAAIACATRAPRIPYVADLDAFVAVHPLADGQRIRADEVGRTATASYHVVQIRGSETPHRHVGHDLTVVVLRGRGTLTRGGEAIALGAGDSGIIARGEAHWFASAGHAGAVALVVFSPPLDGSDTVPLDLR
jgi:mannose-6-phosphate isomerase-like protein (cupin superfamily)